ncbi:MAG: Gar1/Naf1 family protein [Candidatus Bathyarchaeota archaeon]|nr:Gar1/Naf1 family protein [Candidatus Bathyarchaeota archaeon]
MRPQPRLGTAFHISSSSGNLILKAESNVRIGDDVFDGDGRKIGAVFDILGPVSSPFVAVKPRVDAPERYVGEPLFSGRIRR